MKYTLQQLITELRKTDTFLYFFSISIPIVTTENYASCFTNGKFINYSQGLLDDDRSILDAYNFQNLSLSGHLFILAHELAHVALQHCDRTDTRHELAEEENKTAYHLAIETAANCFAIEILGYSIEDVVHPLDKSKPIITMLSDSIIGKSPKGLHWYEIYNLIKHNKNLTQQSSSLDSDRVMLKDSDKDAITKILKQATQLAGNKAPSVLKELEDYADKAPLPYEALIQLCKASVKTKQSSWKKPNKKQLPLKGKAQVAKLRKILAFIDVSCSVPKELVTKFLMKLLDADKEHFEISVVYFNTEVLGEPVKLDKSKKVTYPLGGGTSFKAVADYWNANSDKYDLAINITDGYDELPKDLLNKYVWLIHTQNSFKANEPVYILKEVAK